jgi:hypothetical protein
MNHRFTVRAMSFGTLTAALAATLSLSSTAAHAQQGSSACDRACLRQALDTYLAGVFKHDPSTARLTDDHYATLNTAVVHSGEGFWKDINGYGTLQRRYFDPVNGAAAFLGLLKQNGQDAVSSVRIKVEGGKVSEAEWIVEEPGRGSSAAARRDASLDAAQQQIRHESDDMAQYSPPEGSLPESERSSRFYMISMANNYFQSGANHDASWIPTDLRCKDSSPNPITSSPRHADLCHDNFGIYKNITKDLALRRFPLVDEEAGVILGAAIWVRYPGVTRKDNMVNEYFQIRNGAFTYIWTCNYELPKGSPVSSGWENHQGDITR